jgi:hypothetical protein
MAIRDFEIKLKTVENRLAICSLRSNTAKRRSTFWLTNGNSFVNQLSHIDQLLLVSTGHHRNSFAIFRANPKTVKRLVVEFGFGIEYL